MSALHITVLILTIMIVFFPAINLLAKNRLPNFYFGIACIIDLFLLVITIMFDNGVIT